MAVYRINPGDLATASGVPTGFTQRYGTNKTHSVNIDAGSPSGKSINITGSSTGSRTLTSYDAVNSDGDRATVDIIALIRASAVIPSALAILSGVAARGSGSSSNETAAVGGLGSESSGSRANVGSVRYSAGTSTPAWSSNNSWSQNDILWLRLTVSGTDQTAALYPLNDPLGAAIGSVSNTAPASNADDWVGLFSFASSTDMDYLYIGIATGTDTAADALPLAPELTTATGTSTGSATASLSVSAGYISGTVYAVVTTSATGPSKAQVKAGQDHTGAAAAFADSEVIAATGAQSFSATGLTPETTYYAHFMWEDAIGGQSDVETSAAFTTDAAAALVLRNDDPFEFPAGTAVSDTGVTVTVQTLASPPVVVEDFTADIVSGYISISDAAFDTASATFKMVVEKGTYSRTALATVVTS